MTSSSKQIAGNQRRSLRSIRNRLLEMSEQWDGLDQFNMSALEELADQVEKAAINLVEVNHLSGA